MFEKFLFRSLAAVFATALLAATAHADTITHGTTTINMEFVTVGDPGNDPDTTGYGSVDYTYKIGKYEVSCNQWDAAVAADPYDLLERHSGFGPWSGDQPITYITGGRMALFCNWLTSGHIGQGAYEFGGGAFTEDRDSAMSTYGTVYVRPTENEWYKAAYYDPSKPGGAGYWDYPTKHDDPNEPDGIDFLGDTAFDAVFDNGYEQDEPNDVYNTGVPSAYGTMGQGGNVWERGSAGRGGSLHSHDNTAGALHASGLPNSKGVGKYHGFRVASITIPEPGSITLLVCGAVAGLVWWRRRK